MNFSTLYSIADDAARRTAKGLTPIPMIVEQRSNPLDDNSKVVESWHVSDGVCGFAWVNVKPGTSKFARWLKSEGIGRKDSYYGGVTIWIGEHGQSYERKMKHASVLAKVLSYALIEVDGQKLEISARGRLD